MENMVLEANKNFNSYIKKYKNGTIWHMLNG